MITSPIKRATEVSEQVGDNARMVDAAGEDAAQSAQTPGFAELKKRYAELNARRATLDTSDPEAVRAFNEAVAKYKSDLERAR
jgi:hypothetical protein